MIGPVVKYKDSDGVDQPVSPTTPLPVTLTTGSTDQDVNLVAIAGTAVTAGAGAVTAGTQRTTLASDDPAVASLAVIDDWDETDRAKVNVIVGQAGIAAGAGAVGATVPRVTLASDDPAVASLSVLDDWDESDRAKVNIVAGQAGVTAGAGAVAANTPRVTLASDDPLVAKIPASLGSKAASASLSVVPGGLEYETVAASQTAQVLGGTGGTGDFLSHVVFQPTATNAGTSTILDNATVIYTLTTGTLADLRPITVPINAFSVSGAWKITTGASITATAFGDFSA